MTSFFQMLRHGPMLQRARASGFPMPMARLAVRLYRAPRRLALSGAVADCAIAPNQGVAPGCAWATTMVKVYCLAPFDAVVGRHPRAVFDVYIDDVMISAEGSGEQAVADSIVAAADDARATIARDIGAALARQKGPGVGHA